MGTASAARRRAVLEQLALVLLGVLFALLAVRILPGLHHDAPRAWPVGHAHYLFGAPQSPLVALHHGRYHATHHQVVGWFVGETIAPTVVGLLYSAATVVLLGAWARRRFGVAGWLTPLTLATTPAFVALAGVASHEHAGIFWLCATYVAIERTRERGTVEPQTALAILGMGVMAACADHGSLLGTMCLAIIASWQARRSDLRTFAPAITLAAACLLGSATALPATSAELLLTMDARFFFGFDHIPRVAAMLLALGSLVPLAAVLPWGFVVAVRTLRGRETPGIALAVVLLVVSLLEILVLREPGWSSNLLYLCVAASIAMASLGWLFAGQRVALPARLAVVGVLCVLALVPAVGQLAQVARWPRSAFVELAQGMRTGQIEGHGRAVIALAEGVLEPGETLYLGHDVVCSLSCMETGTRKVYVRTSDLAEALPQNGLLLVWHFVHVPQLEDIPALSMSGFRLYDLDERSAEREASLQLRGLRLPFARTLPRALGYPAAEALTLQP